MNKHWLMVACAATVLTGPARVAWAQEAEAPPAAALTASADVAAQLRALYEADWDDAAARSGRVRQADGTYGPPYRLPMVDPASQDASLDHTRALLAQMDRLPLTGLSSADRINAAVFRTNLEHALIDGQFRQWEMPFNSDSNFWTYLDRASGLRTVGDYEAYIARMRDIPRYFDQNIENMRAGLTRGFSVPQVTLAGREASIISFITDRAQDNAFYRVFDNLPASIPAAEQTRLRAEAGAVIEEAVIPAYRGLLAFYRDDYQPRARAQIAARDLPDGQAYYEAQVRKYTTLDLSGEQIHQIGLQEVARIRAEMQQVMVDAGFEGSFDDFLTFLRTDPQFYARTPDELLMVSAWVAKRADGQIGRLIGKLPRRNFTIIPVPEALAPFYTAGRGGLEACQMNTYDLPSRPLYNIPALTLHECAPGHSFQAALAEEQADGPAFRRYTYFSGYGEGWGLYTEYLGVEMGIYRTPYEHFGRLSYEMWRAARLVIDTGVHLKGWSRDQAIDYLASHTALSRHEVETEVDRYISWPGQALSYKLGELTIRRLRTEAEAALGERFDPRPFHDTILALGSVPLTTLEEEVQAFIARGGVTEDATEGQTAPLP
ncbi:DUF885 domain-containing protein [Brevundimonas vesicularis]|uniref:DUF885 domain-containing protein n=1 Tax=Brevundimonas vesicularis TaxID=41276 RepID=UPI0038D4DB1E